MTGTDRAAYNGGYGWTEAGFGKLMHTVFMAGIRTATRMCNDKSLCLDTVKVKIIPIDDLGMGSRSGATDITLYEFQLKYKNQGRIIDCHKVRGD